MPLLEDNTPKHTITNSEFFRKSKEQLGHLILKKMDITGGTDVDWLIERKGGFIIVESKLIRGEHVTIPVGQMIAFERLYERLSSDGKCYFYLFANEENTDFTNPESHVWYFEMSEWKKKKIPQNKTKTGKYYLIKKDVMAKIQIKYFRILIEHHWNEFGKKKIDLKPKSQDSTSKISKKEKAITEAKNFIQEKYSNYSTKSELLNKTRDMLRANHHLGEGRLENYLKIVLSDLKIKHNLDLGENKQEEKKYSVKEIQKEYPNAYEYWTKSDDEFLKKFWNDESNIKSRNEKIQELMQKFGRNRGAITSRLNKMGLDFR